MEEPNRARACVGAWLAARVLTKRFDDARQCVIRRYLPLPHGRLTQWTLHSSRHAEATHDTLLAEGVLTREGVWRLKEVEAEGAPHLCRKAVEAHTWVGIGVHDQVG